MQKTNSKFLTCLTITVSALCAFLSSTRAQPVTPIFNFTDKSWQYYQAGNQPANIGGVDWKATNYNDSAWTPGLGTFAFEPDTPGAYPTINSTLNRGTPQIITYYFRTHFNFPTNPGNMVLYFTNIVDDGCVVYLNGLEVYRIRMPAGTPAYATPASGTGNEGEQELRTAINPARLIQGDNVLAVELHDTAGSSDVAWTLGLAYGVAQPIVITRHPPAKVPAVAFDDVSLAVEVTGDNPRYWWFRNNVFLANETNRVLIMDNIALTSAGTYHCVVSNSFSGARSSNSVVTVVPDTFGPRILGAYVEVGETNRLILQFNEDINRSAGTLPISGANSNNYVITILGQTNVANKLPVTLSQVGVGNGQVRLTLAGTNFNRSTNYQICIQNIGDGRTPANIIALNSCVPISFESETNVFGYQVPWMYNEWGIALDDVNWKVVNYPEDPLYWFETAGMFANEQSGLVNPPCTLIGWTMSLGPNTYYFRKTFVLSTNVIAATNNTAVLGVVADDGAVVYLNGTELFRINMPPGPVVYGTRTPVAGSPNVCNEREIAVGHLLGRTNVLAVEVHQFGDSVIGTDRRCAFDASLSLKYQRYPILPQPAPNTVRIRTTNHSPTQVSVYFTNGFGYAIQSKTNLQDPWREVQPPTNRLIVPKANPSRQFYRLEKNH